MPKGKWRASVADDQVRLYRDKFGYVRAISYIDELGVKCCVGPLGAVVPAMERRGDKCEKEMEFDIKEAGY